MQSSTSQYTHQQYQQGAPQQYQQGTHQQHQPSVNQQYQLATQQQTIVVSQQPGALQVYPQNVKNWDTDLCACFDDMESCMYFLENFYI